MARTRVLFTRAFWADAAERAIKSFAQGAVAAWGQDVVGIDKFSASLGTCAVAGLSMATLSIFTSVMSAGVASDVSPASAVPG